MKCSIHGLEFKVIPAGVSKSTGKPYPAFEACPVMGCKEKPTAPLSPPEPIDQAIMVGKELEALNRDERRTYRIERQHSQEMAIRYLELKYKFEPPSKTSKLDLSEKVKLMTNWFQADLEKQE